MMQFPLNEIETRNAVEGLLSTLNRIADSLSVLAEGQFPGGEELQIIHVAGPGEETRNPHRVMADEYGPLIARYALPFPEIFGTLILRREEGPPFPHSFRLFVDDPITGERIEYVRQETADDSSGRGRGVADDTGSHGSRRTTAVGEDAEAEDGAKSFPLAASPAAD